jgi:hypothetical protein
LDRYRLVFERLVVGPRYPIERILERAWNGEIVFRGNEGTATCPHHSAFRARIIAGLSGFFTLSQSRDGPERYGALSRFDTMPSRTTGGARLAYMRSRQEERVARKPVGHRGPSIADRARTARAVRTSPPNSADLRAPA